MNLETLFTKKTKVTYKGVDFEIGEVTLEEVPAIANLVEKFLAQKGDERTRIAIVLKEETESIRKLISSLAGIDEVVVKKLPIDAVIFLASKIIVSNIEIIKKNVIPLSKELAEQVQK